MKIRQLLESATGMSTASVATVTKGSKGMIKRQKPTDNALDSGKLFQETNAAEGKDDKIAQLKKDHDTAVHWSKNEKSPQKREAARQKAEKIKRHLETQYKQGVAEGGASMPGDQYLSIPADQTKLSIGQQMAQDGITYSPDKEDELIGLMAQYMKKAGMSSKQIRYYLSYDEDFIPDQLSDLPKQGAAEGFPKDPNAPKLVRDRKTGKQYDPNKEFAKKMNSPEVMAQMKRMAQKEGVAEGSNPDYDDESRVDELSKDTLKSYVPKRIEKTKGLAKTDYNKAHHIIKKDIPRAMSKLKDPNYGKEQPTNPVEENKKGVRAVKHTVKPRNFVAKNAAATTSGAGAHKDKKKAMKQGDVKHKGKEPAYESKLWAALDRRIIK
jgi:hypothetical protein